jgi:hypothetical protein
MMAPSSSTQTATEVRSPKECKSLELPSSDSGSSTPEVITPAPTPIKADTATLTLSEVATGSENTDNGQDGDIKPSKRYCLHRKMVLEKQEKEREDKAKETTDKEKPEKDKGKDKDEDAKDDKDGKKKKKQNKDKKHKKEKKHKGKKLKAVKDSDSDSDSDSSSSSDSDDAAVASSSSSSSSPSSSSDSSSSDSEFEDDALAITMSLILSRMAKKNQKAKADERKRVKAKKKRKQEKKAAKKAIKEAEAAAKKEAEGDTTRASVLEYKRVDELFDEELHDWDIRDSVPHSKADKYSTYIFTVRRIFDYDGRYTETKVDVKSQLLKDALSEIIGDVRGISLVEDVPELDPNMLFNYENEIKAWAENVSNPTPKFIELEKKKDTKRTNRIDPLTGAPYLALTETQKKQQVDHVKLLLEYLDTEYKNTKATLVPLLDNRSITFDLLWAVLKPGTIMYTTCSGSNEPRAFKLEYAQSNCSFMRGKWWTVEGRYLEYDGKDNGKDAKQAGGFGWGTVMVDIDHFRGARKICSLACYPLHYRKDSEELKSKLIERGKKFVSLRGMQYKGHNGLAFVKKKRQYIKVHVNGRIMIDPVTFRRINPNYVVSSVKSRNNEEEDDENANYFTLENGSDAGESEDNSGAKDGGRGSNINNANADEDDSCSQCECGGDEDGGNEDEKNRKLVRFVRDDKGDWHLVSKADEEEKKMHVSQIELVLDDEQEELKEPKFEDKDYLLASPVVLGWAFNEKLWLEFPVSTVEEIVWNEKAFESLVLPESQKEIVRALVESHTASLGSNTIDDIITGKGRGLVSVLHGPPGVGKTLTAEGIAELLKRPLYCVSSGELGTNPAQLEHELQKILDTAHSWGAVLLLDEADVFLEKRTFSDMHRNALVSIFLRLLEYFQGILFLTTNRVETFDDAFQSRIHVALRYTELGYKAKLKIWKMFFDMVQKQDSTLEKGFVCEEDLDSLAKKNLNGRQIKNIVRTAQALAKSKGEMMDMKHVKTVMGVTEGFENDLKGTGKMDSLNAYA